MKVRVTHEVDDSERLAIGAILTGQLIPATREQVDEYAKGLFNEAVTEVATKLVEAQQSFLNTIDPPATVQTTIDD